jgi:hypothetical protein
MRLFWFGLLALMFMAPANAQVDPGVLQTVKALQDGGHVVIFRHGATYADQADTDPSTSRMSPNSASSMTRDARSRAKSVKRCAS